MAWPARAIPNRYLARGVGAAADFEMKPFAVGKNYPGSCAPRWHDWLCNDRVEIALAIDSDCIHPVTPFGQRVSLFVKIFIQIIGRIEARFAAAVADDRFGNVFLHRHF